MIDDIALRWAVTLLFALSAAECAYTIWFKTQRSTAADGPSTGSAVATLERVATRRVGRSRRTLDVVCNLLHLVMAVAMGVMAWPRGAELPTTGPMIFFLLAAGWFVVTAAVGATTTAARLIHGYHAVMMLAMAWMYAVMNGGIVPGTGGHDHAHHDMTHMDMSAMQMPSSPVWVTGLNWAVTVGFAVAAVWWLHRYFSVRSAARGPLAHAHFGVLCQAMSAAGMAIMFAVML